MAHFNLAEVWPVLIEISLALNKRCGPKFSSSFFLQEATKITAINNSSNLAPVLWIKVFITFNFLALITIILYHVRVFVQSCFRIWEQLFFIRFEIGGKTS